jgi:hypothetical protein
MKMRDASNVLKTVAAIHMRNASNVLKTVPTIHMRDAANALKTAYSSGPPPAVSITPSAAVSSSDTDFANTSAFTASFVGGAPTSIVWSVEDLDNCSAFIVSGQGTSGANVRIVTNDSGGAIATGECIIRCTAVIGGVSRSGTATKLHDFYYSGFEP